MKLVLFGNKSTTKSLLKHLILKKYKPHTLVTLDSNLLKKSNISGAEDSLIDFALENNINVFRPSSYNLHDKKDIDFFLQNHFDIGLCTGWQRLIPDEILKSVNYGIFGWHGSGFEFPNGRGRSPINWSIRLGLKSIFHNCFQYSSGIDDGMIFDTQEFEIKNNDYVDEVISKALAHIKESAIKLLKDLSKNNLVLRKQCNHSFLSFPKLSEKDGILVKSMSSQYALNIVRSCSHPFPGAFVLDPDNLKIRIWSMKLCEDKFSDKELKPFLYFEKNILYLRFKDGLFKTKDYEKLSGDKAILITNEK